MSENSLSRPQQPSDHKFKKVAILFAGGPAPAANAVISAAAVSFLRNDIKVVGIKHGYSSLIDFSADKPLVEGSDSCDDRPQNAQPHAQPTGHHDRHGTSQPG